MNPLTNQTVLEDAPLSLPVPADVFADPDAGDVLTYHATGANGTALPSWLSFDAATRTFSGTPDDAQVGNLDLTVTAADSGGVSVSSTFTLTVQPVNDAPTVGNPLTNQTVLEDAPLSLSVPAETFADPDAGDVLTYSATLANGTALPNWLSFDAATQTFSGTPQVGDVGTLEVLVTATDSGALSASDVFTLTIAPSGGGTVGNDTLIGTAGNDLLAGLAGEDTLQGLGGNDALIGGTGDDLLDGGLGADTMTGGTGNDTYVVDATGDVVTENLNEGTDLVQSMVTYILTANVENLTLIGTIAINGTGNALDNILIGNSAANTLIGGGGHDTYVVGAGDTVTEATNAGIDTVQSLITWTLGANLENLILTGTTAINGTGNTLSNTVVGNSAANVLNGGTGADNLSGGAGNDTYVVDNIVDTVTENLNEGTDLVQSSVTYTLGANVEHLTLTGTTAINGTGNALDNVLTGNNAANVLTGGAGNDTYVVGAGDTVTEAANAGTDTVQSSITWTLGGNLESLTLIGNGAINGTGNSADNVLIGNSRANVLAGGGANDILTGGLGRDTLTGGEGNDIFDFNLASESATGANKDVITDFLSGSDKIDLSGIDAVAGGSDNAFTYINTGAFTSVAGQLRYDVATTTLQCDINGNGVADIEIQLTGVTSLAVSDLIL